jgi:hypothetical protein
LGARESPDRRLAAETHRKQIRDGSRFQDVPTPQKSLWQSLLKRISDRLTAAIRKAAKKSLCQSAQDS